MSLASPAGVLLSAAIRALRPSRVVLPCVSAQCQMRQAGLPGASSGGLERTPVWAWIAAPAPQQQLSGAMLLLSFLFWMFNLRPRLIIIYQKNDTNSHQHNKGFWRTEANFPTPPRRWGALLCCLPAAPETALRLLASSARLLWRRAGAPCACRSGSVFSRNHFALFLFNHQG